MVFIFFIILSLLGFSSFYLNKMSKKTSAILKENYLSVVYAREMTEALININQEITTEFLSGNLTDHQSINKVLDKIDHSFQLEKDNITEPGEEKLVTGIGKSIEEFRDSLLNFSGSTKQTGRLLQLLKKSGLLSQQLVLLSQMNGKAIELKTDDAKAYSVSALTQMSVLGTLCFLIALSFIYSFASYFNERFFQLYNGIKEIVSSNYGQRLYFDGVDEFYEISLLFNQMAEKLSGERSIYKDQFDFLTPEYTEPVEESLEELKEALVRLEIVKKQAEEIISKIEDKNQDNEARS
jgi:methyl-accepting chemotaxis protein